jgi:hypothetical protein
VKKLPLSERVARFWDRALEWMHAYLALDVQPRRRPSVDESPRVSAVEPAVRSTAARTLVTTNWRSAEEPATRPSIPADSRRELAPIYEGLFHDPPVTGQTESTEADRSKAAAVAHAHGGRWDEAERLWGAGLESDPHHLPSLFNRGIAQWRRAAITDDALIQALSAIVLPGPESWKVHWLVALAHMERGDIDAASVCLEQAQAQHPEDVTIARMLEAVRQRGAGVEQSAVVGRHSQGVSGVGVDAGGKLAIAACDDGTATVWDVVSGQCVQVLKGHDGGVTAALLSADGRAALTGGSDGTIRAWDVTTGTCERRFECDAGRIAALSVSPDGRFLMWAANRSSEEIEGLTMQLWDTHTGKRVRVEGTSAAIKSVFLSADGRYAISGGDDKLVRVWDIETGRCLHALAGHAHFVSSVCMSTDGALILSASWDTTLRLWESRTGRCVRVLSGHSALVAAACLSADAAWAASGGLDGTVRLWEVATGRCLRTMHGHDGMVAGVAMSAAGDRLVSGGWDGTVRSTDTSPTLREPCRLLGLSP